MLTMKKKQKVQSIIFIIVVIVAVIFLHERKNMTFSDKTSLKETETVTTFPKKYEKKVNEHYAIDADIIIPEKTDLKNLKTGTAKLLKLREDKIYDFFSKEKDVSDTQTESWPKDENKPAYESRGIRFTNGDTLYISPYDITFSSADMRYIDNACYGEQEMDQYYSTKEDLSFATRKEAYLELKKQLLDFNLDLEECRLEKCYTLGLKKLKRYENCIDVNGNEIASEKNPSWSTDQEGYYYGFYQIFQDVPVYGLSKERSDEFHAFDTVPLHIYQTSDGIKELQLAEDQLWLDIEPEKTAVTLCSIEKVCSAVTKKYADIENGTKVTVTRCELFEYPFAKADGTYTLKPAWLCDVRYDSADQASSGETEGTRIWIDAQTGRELYEL